MQKLWTILFGLFIAILGVWLSHGGISHAVKFSDTTVKLAITNSFYGTNVFVDIYFSSGGVLYTAETNHTITVGATTTSTYTISGNIVTHLSGSGTGTYNETEAIVLEGPDGLKTIQTDFISSTGERVQPNSLQIYLDTQAPTVPILLGPNAGSSQGGGGVLFNWSDSSDGESGFKEYELVVSTSPAMLSPIVFTTTQNSLLVNENLLPAGTLYRFVKAKDNVGNESVAIPSYFTHTKSNNNGKNTSITTGGGNSGGRGTDEVVIGTTLYEKPTNEAEGLTYVFTYYDGGDFDEQKTGIIDIIKKQNRLQILVNKNRDEKMHSIAGSEEIIGEESNTIESLALPAYLQQTGVDVGELQYHLGLIAKYFPNESVKEDILKIISSLNLWHGGIIIFLLLLCYDVETCLNRIKVRKK